MNIPTVPPLVNSNGYFSHSLENNHSFCPTSSGLIIFIPHLKQTIFGLHIIQFVLFDVVWYRAGQIVPLAKHIRQTGKHWLCAERQAVSEGHTNDTSTNHKFRINKDVYILVTYVHKLIFIHLSCCTVKTRFELWVNLSIIYMFISEWECVDYRDSSKGCCTVSRRGCRSLVNCCTPFFSESIIWSFSNFWYLSTIFLSKTNTATSWGGQRQTTRSII